MIDITKCHGEGIINKTFVICDKRKQCLRYIMKANTYQSYFAGLPIDKSGVCEMFWNADTKIEDAFPWVKY